MHALLALVLLIASSPVLAQPSGDRGFAYNLGYVLGIAFFIYVVYRLFNRKR